MVRITKAMQAKHAESLSPWIKAFRDQACSISLPQLPQHLETFPTRWPFPRGDLYHWISLLNRFDIVLERFCKVYKLEEGPQTTDFACTVLATAHEQEGGASQNGHHFESLGYSQDGDRQLVESILSFSRVLLQNCGNRSIYASSSHLNSLLNTTSLSLLEHTLLLGSELAQRYQAAMKRMNLPVRHVSSALLTNHYNIDLDRVTQLALPFSKTVATLNDSAQPATPATPSAKGKEKAYFSLPTTSSKGATITIYASDLVSIIKGGSGVGSSPKTARSGVENGSSSISEDSWDDWGDVKVTYYPKVPSKSEPTASTPLPTSPSPSSMPITPTPIRRSSNLGPHGHRTSNRQTSSEESPPASLPRASTFPISDDTPRPTFQVIEIPSPKIKSVGLHTLLRENISGLPQELQYELLTKLRVAEALTSSLETRRQMLAIRLLAITNLAYIHPEPTFHENVLKQDSDEPRRLQLVYQLAELVHPPAEGDIAIPRSLQTLAFSALDAIATGHIMKLPDVCSALNTNVNHGVLLYVVRKAVAEMATDDAGDKLTADDEWRDSLLSLITSLSVTPRTGTDLVTAGLLPILIEILSLRTTIAERYYPMVLTFLDMIMYSARDAFQTLVSAEGLDALSDLIIHEVNTASQNAASDKGMSREYRSASVDYDIPYFQQQTLKWLLKFIHHLMQASGGFGGNFDRLLRNLIDSSQLLACLRQIIGNAHCFGSIIWTNAVHILNDFINNEPTSFAVIAEAGLSRGLLEAVTGTTITMPEEAKKGHPHADASSEPAEATSSPNPSAEEDDDGDDDDDDDDDDSDDEAPHVDRLSADMLEAPRNGPLARGILPTSDTINIIPQAFGAICLNTAGMKMFQASKALETFFEIFESPEHVKCMQNNKDLPSNLGSSFDELIRHHPPLKNAIMNAILNMVARVDILCAAKAKKDKVGAKLWMTDPSGKAVIADLQLVENQVQSGKGKGKATDHGDDVEMWDADAESLYSPTSTGLARGDTFADNSATPYITAVVTFLSAIFSNSSVRADFCTKGGIECLLNLAQSPCLPYDFWDSDASLTIHQVIALLAESKPHLTLPSLLKRATESADALQSFAAHQDDLAFFAPFITQGAEQSPNLAELAKGTNYAKAFVSIQSLVSTVSGCFQPSPYNHRSTNTIFTQVNVADYYVRLVNILGPLMGASLREEMQLRKRVPDHWRNATRMKDSPYGIPAIDTLLDVEPPPPTADEQSEEAPPLSATSPELPPVPSTPIIASKVPVSRPKLTAPTKEERESPSFKNYITLRYLLSKMSRIVSPFFHTLGKALLSKRGIDSFQKQNHVAIADALADTILGQLKPFGVVSSVENFSYWNEMIRVINELLIEVSRQNERPVQTITLVLQSFKNRGGIDAINNMLDVFTLDIQARESDTNTPDKTTEEYVRRELVSASITSILTMYNQFVNGKNVVEAVQTNSLLGRSERDRRGSEHFSPSQFLVELRMAVLPTVRRLWGSDLIEKGSSQISEKLIDLIRTIAIADSEQNAVKRSDKPITPAKASHKTFKKNLEAFTNLTSDNSEGYSAALASEALYRCNNNLPMALEYCHQLNTGEDLSRRYPIPEEDTDTPPEAQSSSGHHATDSTGTATPDDHPMDDGVPGIVEAFNDIQAPPGAAENGEFNFDELLTGTVPGFSIPQVEQPRTQITIEDLNEERDAIRDNLIDKCLDVINAHGDVTFEISDLITTVVNKSSDPTAQRKVVGETLVIALMSFAGEDDLRASGKKIAAYAHLLALMLRDRSFYTAAVDELKGNLETLLTFVKLSPNHSSEESSPWIAHILLIIEMLLSEDARPIKTKWTPPKDDSSVAESPILEAPEQAVPLEERRQLLEAILEILPRIGKEESLALAVLRILVILTRSRLMAQTMGEKKNIQRLFVMAKQLAGASSARIQSPLMLILRHIIEDDETVKQIMRADIKAFLEPGRQRNPDEKAYLRGLAHTALRNPELFVEVTNEMVKFNRWTYSSADAPSRHHSLVLKEPVTEPTSQTTDDVVQPTVQATEDLTIQDVKPTTEAGDSEMPDAPKPAGHENKLPVVENPDGVIHFLLCELLNYRDVEDKDPSVASADKNPTNGDIAMGGTPTALDASTNRDAKTKPTTKQEFKAEDHPIYIYRCFILQCLTELLLSYNRTKIEFINFKRSAPPQAMTPSKPRSSVVNYLLFDLIPLGTLDHADNTVLRKKLVTSSWADSVLTALLSKTGEQPIDKTRDPYESENESDLLFVRKFVLENILKAYKEASSSNEALDIKYSRMLALADLMYHIMHGKEHVGVADTALAAVSQKQLRRIMFDKGFVAALTGSIADIDLNFPGAKRAIKYILRPLKTLTTTAINLSDLSLISTTSGQADEEEIESATSISDPEDEREETPDLFRNSTLGMFEPGREGDSSSGDDDDDEEMDYDEYGDEMEYDEEDQGDDEDNISEEEEIEGMGPIEGLPGTHGVDLEVIMDDDDDDEGSGEGDDENDSDDDDDAHVEIIEEDDAIRQLGADDEDEGEWESEEDEDEDEDEEDGEEEDYEGQVADAEEEQMRAMENVMDGPLGSLMRALGAPDGLDMSAAAAEMLSGDPEDEGDEDDEEHQNEHDHEHVVGEYAEDGDEEEDDEDEDELMDEDEMFDQYGIDVDVGGAVTLGGGWQDEEPPMVINRRPRGGFSPFPSFPGGARDPLGGRSSLIPLRVELRAGVDALRRTRQEFENFIAGLPLNTNRTNPTLVPDIRGSYRSHRPNAQAPRSAYDGMNPLLQRNGSAGSSRDHSTRAPTMGSWIQAMGRPGAEILDIGLTGRPLGESPAASQFMRDIMRSLPPLPGHLLRHGHALQFHITTGPGRHLPPDLEALFGSRQSRLEGRHNAPEHGSATCFIPQSTAARWLEESKILFSSSWLERAVDLSGAILFLLVPPAIEADRAIKAAEAEKQRKLEEELKKKADEERIAREAKEAEEKLAREKKEAEEREAAERAAAEALAAGGSEPEEAGNDGSAVVDAVPESMEGVETEAGEPSTEGAEESSTDRPRITTIIRGTPYDITDFGIDADFLAELPEDLREEVIMSAVAERRSQAAATGAQPSDIDQEFLNALPDDIRDEIIQQERADRRRREREERNRQAAAVNGGQPDMDAATILATLDPAFRNQVLMEQDDATLALLPPELANQARAAMREHPMHARGPRAFPRMNAPSESHNAIPRPVRRAIVQMLDKPGVATLLRLMFIFQNGSLRSTLNSVLQNISMNRHNRQEVLSTLLHILQDGSIDMPAVERSFAQLSLRAKQPKDGAQPKTPQPLKRALTGLSSLAQTNFEASPLMVVQQCLTALVYLNQVNPHVPMFFLSEHDNNAGGLKRTLSKKGKGKENKANKFALNSLLSLLDRDLIMESSSVMEGLSTLLNMITSPLQALQRKQKEAEEAAQKTDAAPSVTDTAASVASPETTTTTTEQPSEPQREPPASEQPVVTTAPAEISTSAPEGEASTSAGGTSSKPEAPKEPEKKQRPINPPVIPEHNLKLVINIFVARECSSKTFRETLSTIKNLSAIPGAKAVFGRELITKAQGLGDVILVDLEELLPQIEKATTGTEIQGVALAKFSPGGSDQNKLLRVLTALDHLFDPKREKKDEKDADSSQLVEKLDLLSSLYENPTFSHMWDRLSACLKAIRQREHMLNVATILLPLIESLMVVCKNTTLKDTPISKSQIGREMILTSPPPESHMENLFFTFTEEHRKILNDLVRHTPKLMSGTFSLLVKNPKVLEFDNKRNFFTRSIHNKAPNSRQSFPPLQLAVRREQVFHDSFKSLYFQTGDQMKYGKLSIRFHGEEGVDAGGVTREWFQVLSRQMFDPGYALFIPVSSDRTTFHPNQLSSINEEHLMFFKFIGRIIGKALYEGRVLDCHFSRAVYKRILGKAVSVKDMESLDPDYYKSLVWMLENDITDIITETFSVDNDKFGVVETIDFIPNGRNVAVTEENKHEYVRLMVEWKLTGSVKEQLDEFLKGFHDIIPAHLIAIFNEQELELLISGLPEIDVDDWKSNTEYHNYSASSPQIQWFWRAVRSFDKEERAKLLQFVTGTSKVPLNGFRELEGMNGFSRFNIHRDYGSKDRLPSSHTCFNQLDLPEYENYEALRQQVLTAITAGSEYFGFA